VGIAVGIVGMSDGIRLGIVVKSVEGIREGRSVGISDGIGERTRVGIKDGILGFTTKPPADKFATRDTLTMLTLSPESK
jgi:hypothetical protein